MKDWTWGELPDLLHIQRGQTKVPAYPSLVDQGDCVGLRLLDSESASLQSTRQGLVRLFALKHRKHLRSQVQWLPQFDQHAVYVNRVIKPDQLKRELADLIVRAGMVEGKKLPRTADEFTANCQKAVESISLATQEVAKWFPKFCEAAQKYFLAMEKFPEKFFQSKTDLKEQKKHLLGDEFMRTPWKWLRHYPRYLNAMVQRIEKIPSNSKEDSSIAEIGRWWDQYVSMISRHEQHSITDFEIETFRWMIEEYRVSLFAQQLGTAVPVSSKRLEKQWAKVQKI